MRAVEGSLGHSLKRGIENWKTLAREKARLGALGVGRVKYCAQWSPHQPPRSKSIGDRLASAPGKTVRTCGVVFDQ
jgi:hypothetical protein